MQYINLGRQNNKRLMVAVMNLDKEECNVGALSQFLQGTTLIENQIEFTTADSKDDLDDLFTYDGENTSLSNMKETSMNKLKCQLSSDWKYEDSSIELKNEIEKEEEKALAEVSCEDKLSEFELDDSCIEIENISLVNEMDDETPFDDCIFEDNDVAMEENNVSDIKSNGASQLFSVEPIKHISAVVKSISSEILEQPSPRYGYDDKAEERYHNAKTSTETDVITFQYNLNEKLESLVHSMKRTEQSRHLLANHSYRRNSLGNPEVNTHNAMSETDNTSHQPPLLQLEATNRLDPQQTSSNRNIVQYMNHPHTSSAVKHSIAPNPIKAIRRASPIVKLGGYNIRRRSMY